MPVLYEHCKTCGNRAEKDSPNSSMIAIFTGTVTDQGQVCEFVMESAKISKLSR